MTDKQSINAKQQYKPRYQTDWHKICAILPAYLQGGVNGTIIYYTDGTTEQIGHRLMWVLDDWLYQLRTSRALLQKQSIALLNIKSVRRLPLCVAPAITLVPVKGRRRRGIHDSMVGYIVAEYVQDIQVRHNQNQTPETIVYLIGAQPIPLLDNARCLKQKIKLARTVQLMNREEERP